MKPVKVSFQAFGPYRERQEIDFTQFAPGGLFLISGETGSGKTTILDAICYALYGEASNKSRGDLMAMRCKQAEPSEATEVDYIFDIRDKRYRFRRTLRMGRVRWIDEHTCMEYRDGVYVPVFENPKMTFVNKKAEELIGLNAEQFRQVIILPQGKFETLLTSDSSAKEAILTSIFHADRWDRIISFIHDAVDEEKKQLTEQSAVIEAALRRFDCEKTEALALALESVKTNVSAQQTKREKLEKEKDACMEKLQQATAEQEKFDALQKTQKALETLLSEQTAREQEKERLESAQRAQQLHVPYEALRKAQRDVSTAEAAVKEAQLALDKAQAADAKAQDRSKQHEAGREAYEADSKRLQRLEDAEDVYKDLAQYADDLARAKDACQQKEKEAKRMGQRLEKKETEMKAAASKADQADEECRNLRERYMRSICGNLAQEALKYGEPCPVCGSTHHPNPAEPPQDGVRAQELDAAEEARENAQKAFRSARDAYERAHGEKEDAQEAMTQAEISREKANAAYESCRSRAIEGIETAEQLAAETAAVRLRVNLYEREQEDIQKQLSDAQADCTAKRELCARERGQLDSALENAAQADASWQQACRAADFADTAAYLAAAMEPQALLHLSDTQADYWAALHQTQALLQTQAQAVRGKTRHDLAALQTAAKAAEDAWSDAKNQEVLLVRRQEEMEKALAELREKQADYALLQQQYENDAVFYKRISGTQGVGLKRYVLGVMLASVTGQANRMLQNVYGGRYSLYRTNESADGKRRSGLELEVLDHHGNERRSVRTLSGGEKFLVALSLAIGLSTVVQSRSGGVRLDAMFIDEGFGTLDKNTVQDALDILQNVRMQNGVVGIISHVEALAENIPAQIGIIKQENGSRCVLRGI